MTGSSDVCSSDLSYLAQDYGYHAGSGKFDTAVCLELFFKEYALADYHGYIDDHETQIYKSVVGS